MVFFNNNKFISIIIQFIIIQGFRKLGIKLMFPQ